MSILKFARHLAALFGLTIVLIAWTGAFFQLQKDKSEIEQAAIDRASAAVQLFEKDTVRMLKGVDAVLLMLRHAYYADRANFRLESFADEAQKLSDVALNFGFVNREGYLTKRTTGLSGPPIYLGDRDHFVAQKVAINDRLYIGKTVLLRVTGEASLQVSRALREPGGGFEGILVASIDPAFAKQFSEALKLGANSSVSVWGLDGQLRAAYGFKTVPTRTLAIGVAERAGPSGTFWGTGTLDGVARLIAYRTLAEHALIITVGESTDHIFEPYAQRKVVYLGIAALVTFLALIFVLLIRRRHAELEEANNHFSSALRNLTHGLTMFDGQGRLIAFNDQWLKLYGFTNTSVRVGMTLAEIYGPNNIIPNVGLFMEELQLQLKRDGLATKIITAPGGRLVRISTGRRDGGGWVAIHEDITGHKKREDSFRLLFNSNPVPMWLVDQATLRFIDVNDATVAHYGYTRSEFLVMTSADLRFPADVEAFRAHIMTGAKTHGQKAWRHRKADGAAILVSVYAEDLDYEGRPARLCAAIDVTKHKRFEEKLLEQKLHIDTAIDNMSQGLVMFDAQGRVVLFNRRYLEIYSLSSDVVKPGCTLRELIEYRQQAGSFSGDPGEYAQGVLDGIRNGQTVTRSVELSNGRSIQIVNKPMEGGGWVVTHDDITEAKRAQERIERESNEHRRLFELSQDMILVTDRRGQVIRVSPIVESILGYCPDELIGRSAGDVIYSDDLEKARNEMRLARRGQSTRDCETRYHHKDGRLVTLAWSGVWSEPEQIYFLTCRDVTQRKIVDERLKQLAHYDQLTGLPNREKLWNDLSELIYASAEPGGRQTSIAMLDLDGFKDVNDTLGHSTGDRLLLEAARRMTALAGEKAHFYRLGGDEFVLILADCGDPRDAGELVGAVVQSLGHGFDVNGHQIFIGASAGIAIAPAHGSSVDELLSNADLALYEAKAAGGRCYRLFMPVLRAKAEMRRELDIELRRACDQEEFVLYFQPQIRMSDGAITGAEALLRWRHPQRGIIGPGAFIEALADSPVVLEVGAWILETACRTAAALRAKGHDIRMGVNLFPAQFQADRLQADVEGVLAKTGLPAAALEIEITENIALGHDEALLVPLRALRDRGVQLAFDDFGTGYASLSFLTRYPLTRLKIDQSFVRKIAERPAPEDTAIVRSIIMMAHNLGMEVIAEGVETAAQAAFLQAERCDEAQGFLYAKPLPLGEFEEFLVAAQIRSVARREKTSAA
jgi:diguanylate cyclase (GGDEF)-like protein/PAS domain S-box-containing protein